MGCNISEKIDASSSQAPSSSTIASKRFKIPKKFLDHCNGIDHASVPRKLRSAMKKRNRESILLDTGKLNHKMNGVETPEKDGIKKSKKQRTPDWSLRQTLPGSITRDEEEVAETLYALAGMFPDSGLNCRSKLDGMSMPERSILPDIEIEASPNASLQGTGQDASSCCAERLSGEATKTSYIYKTIDQEHIDFPESAKFLMASNSGAAAPKMNLQTMSMLVKSDYGNEISLDDSELRLAIGQYELPHVETKLEIASEMNREGKQEHRMIKEPKRNEGPALWSGLSPAATAGNQAYFLRSTAAKAPLWLDAAMCHSKQDTREGCSGGKVSVVADKRSWKRGAAHVHITRLIQRLQVPISKDIMQTQPNQSNQMRAHEGLNHGVLMEIHDLGGLRDEALSMNGTDHSAAANNSHEIEKDIFKQQRLYHDISKATPSGVNSPQKQRFNFLSLSIGVSGFNVNDDYNKVGSGFEPLPKLQVPYLQSPPLQHGLQPFSMPQSQYVSTYRDQVSAGGTQVRLQLPHYYGSPLRGSPTASNKHESFWAAVNCSMTSQYPNWQSGRQDSEVIDPCTEAIQSKITQIPQHFIALASPFPPAQMD